MISFQIAIAGLGLLYFLYRNLKKTHLLTLRGPPSSSWLYGNMRELMLGEFGPTLFEWQRTYGAAFRLTACFGEPRLMLADPKGVHAVLGDNYTFPRSVEHRELARILMGEGILWAEKDDHKRHRNVMQPCFILGFIKQLVPQFVDTARGLVNCWESTLNEDTSTNVIDVVPWMHRAALDVIGLAALNTRFESLVNDENEVANSYHNLLGDSMTRTPSSIVADGILRYIPPMALRCVDYIPSKATRKLKRNRMLVNDLAKGLVQTGLDDIQKGVQGGKDVLTQIVKANLATDESVRMTSREVYAQVSSIMLAGEETVADTVCWSLYELARNPEYQDRIRSEVRECFRTIGRQEITHTDLEKMTFTNAFIKEVLRFHPALPMSQREASRDVTLQLADPITTESGETTHEVRISKGEVVIVNTAGYNRLESVWGPDANEFKPSRWLEGHSNKGTLSPYPGMYANVLTFLGGTRGCLGWRFALMEIQITLMEILKRFRVSLPKDIEIRREMALVIIPVVVGDEARTARLPLEVSLLEG